MAKITINGVSFDPDSQMPALAAAGMEEADSRRSNYILVQTTHPLVPAEREALEAAQATPLEHVPGSAYICSYAPNDLDPVRQLPFVRWAHVYLDNFKIAPRLRGNADGPARVASATEANPVHASMSQQPRTVDVVLHRDADVKAVAVDLAKAVRLDPDSLKVSGGKLRVTVQPQMLERITRIDAVRHLEEYVPPQLHNTVAVRLVGAERVHTQLEFEGDQQVIAVCDTGLDLGSEADVHPAFSGRVKRIYALGRPATASDPHGHGTHVAGSVLGDGSSSSMGGPVRGAAPRARLVMQSVLDGNGRLGGLPDDLRRLFRDPYVEDGARIHTNSWGAPNFGQYTDESHAVDDFVWQHRDMLILFSAGNDGSDRNANGVIDNGSIGSPATAKNCLTIGASESLRPDISKRYGEVWEQSFPMEPIAGDLWADNPNGIAAFSSRGPTSDGRIKPDLVAPGTAILSAHSRKADVGSFWGPSSDPLYCYMGGTSMATPIVAGCAALVREFLARQGLASPSAALVKALLINGARDLAGQYTPSDAGPVPNHVEGFGLVDMEATLGAGSTLRWFDEDQALDTGEAWTVTLGELSPGTVVKATLAWTDPPGEGLQNDLDLIVRTTADEFHGNVSPGSKGFDRHNNVEQVTIAVRQGGTVDVTVRAFRAALHAQTYALVVRISPPKAPSSN